MFLKNRNDMFLKNKVLRKLLQNKLYNINIMCQRVTCSKCGKYTWSGCGRHIESALAGVPPAQRCQCPRR